MDNNCYWEEARNIFVNLGRAADLKDPEKVARGIIDMFVLRKPEKGFQQMALEKMRQY